MSLRGGPGVAAGMSLLARSGLLQYRGAPAVLRRGGLAAAVGLAALRSPDRPVLVRAHDQLTGRELDIAVEATTAAIAERWPAGSRIGLRSDGGIDFVIAVAAAGWAGLDVMPIGPRLGTAQVDALAGGLDAIIDAREVAVRDSSPVLRRHQRPGRLLVLSTGTGGKPAVTARGRVGARGMLQLADADRRLRLPSGPLLVLAPPDHGHGLTMVLAGLSRGLTVLLASGISRAGQAEVAARHRPLAVSGVPTQLGRLLDAEPIAFDDVRVVVSGSSRLPGELRSRLAAGGARLLDCYGSTETGTVAIDGRPLAGVTIDVDGAGRILITSPLGGRAVSAGDVGRIEAGRLVLDGRAGSLIDTGGELVAPERVTATLLALPGVVAAQVAVEHDDLLGSRLRAEVTVSDPSLDASGLARELAERVGAAAVPWTLAVRVEPATDGGTVTG